MSGEIKLANCDFEDKVQQLVDLSRSFGEALAGVGIRYRIVGGFAAYLHVDAIDPMAARLTRDLDVAIERKDFDAIRSVAEAAGFRYRCEGDDPIFESAGRRVVHLVFIGEKVRPGDLLPIPASEPTRTDKGILIAPVADLVRMKLTSFRLKDKVHIQDMDSVGLITAEIEQGLPEALRERLKEVRATE